MRRLSLAIALCCASAFSQTTAADTGRQIQRIGFDPAECYRVIDLNFAKDDVRVYFTSGYLIFAQPVNGARLGALFVTDVEGGDAEVLLLPPLRSERLSLAGFTESPNLNEHFKSALLLFTGNTGEDLRAKASGAKRVPEMGALLAASWDGVLKNFASSFQVRLVEDTLNKQSDRGMFYMALAGTKLGNFDVFCDPMGQENILVGQLTERKQRSIFDVWTSYSSRSQNNAQGRFPEVALENFRIEASLDADLMLKAVTRVTVTARQPVGRALPFSISRQMQLLEAKVDGLPAEVFQRESLRSNLMNASGNEDFVVVSPVDLEPGKPHEFEFRHEGAVIAKAGDQVYYVAARGNWYPNRGVSFATYDLTFRYPKDWGFVATGDVVADRVEGNLRVTRRKTSVPIRFAGFNLGNYKSVSVAHEPFRVEVYANRQLESALQARAVELPPTTPPSWNARRGIQSPENIPIPTPPNPTARLEALANNVAGAFDFMASQFGPPPIKTLTVSPIPGGFGQGFPGLLYLSTLAYLDPSQRPAGARDRIQQTFYSEMLDAHEVAHQWWGNLVFTASYQDAWLMEALANYSALMFLEKKKGPRAMEVLLEDYRTHLLAKGPNGNSLESAGPITWGYRLGSSLSPEAWHYITYEKGAWVVHMLRRRLGDERFLAMLRAMCVRYQYRSITTEQFRELAQEFAPPHAAGGDLAGFFDNWVYGTGIPAVKMNYAVKGFKITGAVTQSDVSEDFTARVPIEVQTGRQKMLYWVATGSEPAPFSITVKAVPTKVSVAVKDALITLKK